MSESMVQVRSVTKVYERGKQKIEVLHGLTLDIPKGDFVALMGPSGSGKTTLLNLIGGLDKPTSGEIVVGGSRIDQLSSGQLAHWRAHNVGFVFQFYNLMPVLSAEGNVELPLLLTRLSAAQRRKNVAVALQVVGLADRAHRGPGSQDRGGDPRPAAGVEPRARQDDRDRHPRSQGRRVRAPHPASGEGPVAGAGGSRRCRGWRGLPTRSGLAACGRKTPRCSCLQSIRCVTATSTPST